MVTKRSVVVAGLLAAAFGAGVLVDRATTVVAQPQNRVLEIRTYTTEEGHLNALVNRMRLGEARMFDKSGMNGVLFSIAAEPPKSTNTFVYIVAHKSLAAAKESWGKFRADPEWLKLRDSMESPGPIKVDSTFVNPVDFSPLK